MLPLCETAPAIHPLSIGIISIFLISLFHISYFPPTLFVLNVLEMIISFSLSGSQLFLSALLGFLVYFRKVNISKAFCLHLMFLFTLCNSSCLFSFSSNISTLSFIKMNLDLHRSLPQTFLQIYTYNTYQQST